jgi:hypothetical protein
MYIRGFGGGEGRAQIAGGGSGRQAGQTGTAATAVVRTGADGGVTTVTVAYGHRWRTMGRVDERAAKDHRVAR